MCDLRNYFSDEEMCLRVSWVIQSAQDPLELYALTQLQITYLLLLVRSLTYCGAETANTRLTISAPCLHLSYGRLRSRGRCHRSPIQTLIV